MATNCFFYAIFQTMKNNQPIGIFDSGIGGLTVANAIKKALPNESIIYFGDTKHLPYGEKFSGHFFLTKNTFRLCLFSKWWMREFYY